MKQFNDKAGRAWQIDLTIGTVMRVRSADPAFDLLDPAKDIDGRPLQAVLSTEVEEFWSLLWRIVAPQAEAKGIDATAFGEAMAADCLIEAQIAFFAEWRDFFQSLRRPDAALAVETQAKTMTAAMKLVATRISTFDQTDLMKRIESQLERQISVQFGKLRESLDAIQEDSLGDKST